MKQGKNLFISLRKFFHSSDDQILTFLIFKCHDIIKCPRMNWDNLDLLNNLGSKHSLGMKVGQFMYYYKRKKKYPKILRKM